MFMFCSHSPDDFALYFNKNPGMREVMILVGRIRFLLQMPFLLILTSFMFLYKELLFPVPVFQSLSLVKLQKSIMRTSNHFA